MMSHCRRSCGLGGVDEEAPHSCLPAAIGCEQAYGLVTVWGAVREGGEGSDKGRHHIPQRLPAGETES